MAMTNGEMYKRWAAKNPERLAAYRNSAAYKQIQRDAQKKYKSLNPLKAKESKKKWELENREKHLASRRALYAKNRQKIIDLGLIDEDRKRKRERAAKYRSRNPDQWKKYWAANKSDYAARTAKYRAAMRLATPLWADKEKIKAIYRIAFERSKETGLQWHVDHIVPLISKSVCGLHVESNLAVIEASKNMSKNNRYWPDMAVGGH